MPKTQMLINYVPGEECRVAVAEDGKLEELHQESTSNISRVGNVYVGVVANVEPAIQAAFIDFGVEDHGFLHITDLHPQYFPGEDEETTERIGKKTSRRDRPPIQQCLKRGQEVVVQVLKEGIGTKGPTLTSYLSIPGRFLVMMPQMDRVGVSRKVEDEDLRRKMREILDQLELPEGFGFIVRTAGLDRNKTELKRDLAYLQRLWKDMEKRQSKGRGPRLLYAESDLLLRALRDLVGPETNEVIIDNELALRRAGKFIKIVSPRAQTKLLHYTGHTPIFHAFGIEEQILNIHAREVPLPSGGRLVIDETEALVAIDVNSGKSRSARDAETNAFRTNLEAVDAICRQLRLRDLGGVVVNDLIDMRDHKHRREIEARFKERLKRDRARSTVAPISEFGILEMTRQRMRGSHESVHFVGCPTCRGRGLVQRPDSVAADALRSLAALLDYDKVGRVEMVVSPRVAGELLSSKRRGLARLERQSGKQVDVRVSETLPVDRVSFYAYDPAGADVDVEKLAREKKPSDLVEWVGDKDDAWAVEPAEEVLPETVEEPAPEALAHPIEMDLADLDGEDEARGETETEGGKKKKRRRRRRGARAGAAGEPVKQGAAADRAPDDETPVTTRDAREAEAVGANGTAEEGGRKRRRRRRRRRGGAEAAAVNGHPAVMEDEETEPGEPAGPRAGRSAPPPRAGGWGGAGHHGDERVREEAAAPAVDDTGGEEEAALPAPDREAAAGEERGGRKRRRRRRRRVGERAGDAGEQPPESEAPAAEEPPAAERRDEQPDDEAAGEADASEKAGGGRKRRRRRRGRGEGRPEDAPAPAAEQPEAPVSKPAAGPRASSGYRNRAREAPPPVAAPAPAAEAAPAAAAAPPKPKRFLYAAHRRLSPSEASRLPKE